MSEFTRKLVAAHIEVRIKDFDLPPLLRTADGEALRYAEVPALALEELCDRFREDVFAKAGKLPPDRPGCCASGDCVKCNGR